MPVVIFGIGYFVSASGFNNQPQSKPAIYEKLCSSFLVNIWYPVPMYLTITLSLIIIFIFFHEELTKKLAEKEKELTESRTAIMVSQIQPHFLNNSLNVIYHLCDKDVKLAKQAISNFSEYLQRILGSVNRTTPIPFEEELQYVRNYLELEQMRFDEDLNVVYHIESTGLQKKEEFS